MSAFADLATLEPKRIWEGVVGRVVHSERLTLAVVELDPRCVIPEHSHANEQVGLLLAGSLVFRVGTEEQRLKPGSTWRISAGVPHEVHTGPNGAVVVEVFAPPRSDWDALDSLPARAPRWPSGLEQRAFGGRTESGRTG
jgi:quercetin dioxygenase-like cupin family protein